MRNNFFFIVPSMT